MMHPSNPTCIASYGYNQMGNNVVSLSFKVWNWAMGLGGIATITYAIFLFRVSQETPHPTIPWFFHAILFVGIMICAVTSLGHFAAATANNGCLATYIVVILLLFMFEAVIITPAFLHPFWEKDMLVSDDNTDSLVSTYIWKYLASLIYLIQAVNVILAAVSIHQREAGITDASSEREYEDDDPRVPLSEVVVDPWQHADHRFTGMMIPEFQFLT